MASSSVIPHQDPTLLFINAGMNQFKDLFLGKSQREYRSAATSQKCIRVGGKHNDLENVGHTRRHLTLFEMLGNFSFGDYFKQEAIHFAWEVSTEVFGFPPEKIWPTVYQEDEEAFELWTHYVPAEKITRMGKKSNFWQMGDTGPCGPCSELLFDRGSEYGEGSTPLEDVKEERFLEFWNLVFMQYNRLPDGSMSSLPTPSIDTGSGLERVVSLKMNVESVFETDILRSLIAQVEKISKGTYRGIHDPLAPAYHTIADHLRSLSFAISDGAQPSNIERGYVLRKVLRRAVRYGKSLGLDRPFLGKLVPHLVAMMGEDYPELKLAEQRIVDILTTEEESFLRTLQKGGALLHQVIDSAKRRENQISGDDAFKLKDTFGLPFEEISLMAKDANLTIDKERYVALEEQARAISKKGHKTSIQKIENSIYTELGQELKACRFIGFTALEGDCEVVGLLKDGERVQQLQQEEEGVILLDQTPFYPEKGGQVGDCGLLTHSSCEISVKNTTEPFPGIIAHHVLVAKGRVELTDHLRASVEATRRIKIANSHTATHLLHWALQHVLGTHVKQAGSLVEQEKIRFDFSHHKGLTAQEIREVEEMINAKIRSNTAVKSYEIEYEQARQNPEIKQFFGDKYGLKVRVVDIDYSKELCGGTHAKMTGDIGLFRIAKESSVAAGVRRIEAFTGQAAENFSKSAEDLLLELTEQLKTKAEGLPAKIASLLEENRELTKTVERTASAMRAIAIADILKDREEYRGHEIVVAEIKAPIKELKIYAEQLLSQLSLGVVLIGAREQQSCNLIAATSAPICAKSLIETLAPIIGGKGGGKKSFAQAGGKMVSGLPKALEQGKELIFASL